jgi:ribosomal protein S18 acetylase RimI-like enzyme
VPEAILKIRQASASDYPLIADLFRDGFGVSGRIPADYVSNLCYSDPEGCFVGEIGGEMVGYATVHRAGTVGYIGNLVVVQAHRRRGYGRKLVDRAKSYLLTRCDIVGLGVEPRLSDNIRLYKSLGFIETSPSMHVSKDTASSPPGPDGRLILGSDIRDQASKFISDILIWSDEIIPGLDFSWDLQRFITKYPAQILFLVEDGRPRGFLAYHDHFRTDPWGAVEHAGDRFEILSALVNGGERLFESQPRLYHIQTNFTKLPESFAALGYAPVDEKTAMVLSEHRDKWQSYSEAAMIRPWWS